MTKKEKLAYLTGVFDGEGCIVLTEPPKILAFKLSVQSTDSDIIHQFQDFFGGYIYKMQLGSLGKKESWRWQVSKRKEVERILRMMLPYLCERRKTRALELLNYPIAANHSRDRTHCPRGHKYTPKNTYKYVNSATGKHHRACRACRRVSANVELEQALVAEHQSKGSS